MKEIRFHGRGGQGAVTAAELFAQAAIDSGLYAQAFPNFGAERRGAPVTAFLRVSDSQIFLRERIDTPDIVVVLDPSLIALPEVTAGLPSGKTLIFNGSRQHEKNLEMLSRRYRVGIVDAGSIAMETIGLPITNTAIVGALAKATALISPESLNEPFKNRFGTLAERNIRAMRRAHEEITFHENLENDSPVKSQQQEYSEYLKKEALFPWKEVEIGCDVHRPGSSKDFITGNWRTGVYPRLDAEKCIGCAFCWILCPEMAFSANDEQGYSWNGDYCKGCGICVASCPKKALSMEEEK